MSLSTLLPKSDHRQALEFCDTIEELERELEKTKRELNEVRAYTKKIHEYAQILAAKQTAAVSLLRELLPLVRIVRTEYQDKLVQEAYYLTVEE